MSAVYTYSKARQQLATLLEQARRDGEVRIVRRDGQVFLVRPVLRKESPLDVPSITLGVKTPEIVRIIRSSRRPVRR
jgi:hypothetical protein